MKNLEHFKNLLTKERELIISELKGVGSRKNSKSPDDWQGKPEEGDLPTDPNEVADRIESYEGNSAIVNELDQRLMEVDHALHKIQTGKYGKCEINDHDIEESRLEANPAARTCIEHKSVKLPPTPDLD